MDTLLGPLLDDLRACLCEQLERTTAGSTCSCLIYAGTSAPADRCSCGKGGCGMAWVRLARVFPAGDAFPAPDRVARCDVVLAAQIEVGVRRCQPVPNQRGEVDAGALVTSSLAQADDVLAMARAFQCCDAVMKRPHTLGQWSPEPAGGDCLGGTWPVTVQLVRR